MVKGRRLAFIFVFVTLVLIGGGLLGYWLLLDPGSKHDTSTDLVTPTIEARTARVYEVAADESQVDFVTQVSGIELAGVFPVESGTIILEPVGDELRVLVQLNIDVDSVDMGNSTIDRVMRAAMATGDYPIAFYVATSRENVPVTEEVINFILDGKLDVHNVPADHTMTVEAQAVGSEMWAVATSDLDLGNHGVEFPALINTSTIKLTARLKAYEVENITGTTDQPE